MNMFGHPNARRIVTFETRSFAFIPPDGLDSPGRVAAKWPVVIFEVSNEEGRRKFGPKKGDKRIENAGVALGARVFEGQDRAFEDWAAGVVVRDEGLKVSGQAGGTPRRERLQDVGPDWVVEEHPPALLRAVIPG